MSDRLRQFTGRPLRALLVISAALAVLGLHVASAAAYSWVEPRQCPDGARWPAERLPMEYRIHQAGSADISNPAALERAVRDGIEVWQRPCCSSFQSTYGGRTDRTATDTRGMRDGRMVLSWRQKNWPAQLGAPTLTVAVGSPTISQCKIVDGTILFNDEHHRFSTRPGLGELDLQSVVAHETGHLLGLGHSRDGSATMHQSYRGGTEMRTLARDDIDGLCALYPDENNPCRCRRDEDCYSGTRCRFGQCVDVPCGSDAECEGVRVCDSASGDCRMPRCSSDADCPDRYSCGDSGSCIPTCAVCRPCTDSSQCGPTGQCVDFRGGRCIIPCTQGDCPGDATCQSVRGASGRTYQICLNPGAASGRAEDICPEDYVCGSGSKGMNGADAGAGADTGPGADGDADAGTPGGACPSLGNSCSSGDQSACGPDSAGCMLLASGRQICTCTCQVDADCGSGANCVTLANGSWCVPARMGKADEHCDAGGCNGGNSSGGSSSSGITADVNVSDAAASPDALDGMHVREHPTGGCSFPTERGGHPVPLPFVAFVLSAGLLHAARSRRRESR